MCGLADFREGRGLDKVFLAKLLDAEVLLEVFRIDCWSGEGKRVSQYASDGPFFSQFHEDVRCDLMPSQRAWIEIALQTLRFSVSPR